MAVASDIHKHALDFILSNNIARTTSAQAAYDFLNFNKAVTELRSQRLDVFRVVVKFFARIGIQYDQVWFCLILLFVEIHFLIKNSLLCTNTLHDGNSGKVTSDYWLSLILKNLITWIASTGSWFDTTMAKVNKKRIKQYILVWSFSKLKLKDNSQRINENLNSHHSIHTFGSKISSITRTRCNNHSSMWSGGTFWSVNNRSQVTKRPPTHRPQPPTPEWFWHNS